MARRRHGYGVDPYIALVLHGLQQFQSQRQSEEGQLLALAQDPGKTGYSMEPVAEPPKGAGFFARMGGRRYADPNIVSVGGQPFRVNYKAPEGPISLGDLAAAGQLQGVPEALAGREATPELVDMFSRVRVAPEGEKSTALQALGTIQEMRERQGAGPVSDERQQAAAQQTLISPAQPPILLPPVQAATLLEKRQEGRYSRKADRQKAEIEAAERERKAQVEAQRLGFEEERLGFDRIASELAEQKFDFERQQSGREAAQAERKLQAEAKERAARVAKLQSEVAKNEREASGVMSRSDQIDLQRKVRGDIRQEPVYKDYENALNGYQSVSVGAQRGDGQGDLAIINGIVRLLDPGSVNRPSEVAAAMQAQGWLERLKTWSARWKEGDSLGPEARQKFLGMAEDLYKSYSERASGLVTQVYGSVLQDTGLSLEDVFVEPSAPKQPPKTPGAPGAPEASEGKGFLKEFTEGVGEVIGGQKKPAQPPPDPKALTPDQLQSLTPEQLEQLYQQMGGR